MNLFQPKLVILFNHFLFYLNHYQLFNNFIINNPQFYLSSLFKTDKPN